MERKKLSDFTQLQLQNTDSLQRDNQGKQAAAGKKLLPALCSELSKTFTSLKRDSGRVCPDAAKPRPLGRGWKHGRDSAPLQAGDLGNRGFQPAELHSLTEFAHTQYPGQGISGGLKAIEMKPKYNILPKESLDLSCADSVLAGTQAVFFDFDNTITSFDVLDDIIDRFCFDKECRRFELLWQEGEISSAECLRVQMGLIKSSRREIEEYLAKVEIDPYFKKLLFLFKEAGIKVIILSDSFHFLIENVLRNNRLEGIDIYANKMEFTSSGIKTYFPYASSRCLMCGHCKKETLLRLKRQGKTIFIGDGRYDLCPAMAADFIFAKDNLAAELKKKIIPFEEFDSLADIYSFLTHSCNKAEI